MTLGLMLLVLFAAALHAGWNAIVKSSPDKSSDVVLVAASAAAIAATTLPFIPLPTISSWPYLLASVAIHLAYFSLVGLAYRHGDLSYAYPLMRGSAPLITTGAALLLVGETLRGGGYVGVLLLSAGVLALSFDGFRNGNVHMRATGYAIANAFVVALYTLVDGIGVRLSGNALSYAQWLFFLNAIPLVVLALSTRRAPLLSAARARWKILLLGGLCTIGSYGLVLWAMTRAPLALVAALREMSVVFGTVFAAVFLKEKFGMLRYVAAGLVTAGAVAMKVL
ncbi:MAG TPA: EamA family transporter [Burkholderiales bacterium]|nr:EamA family transporter [Burkholderiales bacterium]